MTLNDGGTATYTGGSGTSALTFSYTVLAGQNTPDLMTTAVNLNGATIKDGAGNGANLSLSGITQGSPQIDTTAPTVSSLTESPSSGDLNAGKVVTLTVNLSEAVTVAGTPTLTLNDGGTATYTGGSGTSALTFSYTVAAGQNTAGLAATAVNLNTATVKDGAGNAANLSLTGLTQTGPQIDTTAPHVTMALVSDTGTSSTDRITSNPAVTGSSDPNALITLREGTTVVGTTTANASGTWSVTPTGLPQGSQTITASETDGAGNTSTASVSFTLDSVAPAAPVIVSDKIIGKRVTLSGTGDKWQHHQRLRRNDPAWDNHRRFQWSLGLSIKELGERCSRFHGNCERRRRQCQRAISPV